MPVCAGHSKCRRVFAVRCAQSGVSEHNTYRLAPRSFAMNCIRPPGIKTAREEMNMSQAKKMHWSKAKKMLLGTAFVAMGLSASAFAQTAHPAADATGQISAQTAPAAQAAPAPQNLVAPAPTDPFVQKRNANAQASAEYKASKKAS